MTILVMFVCGILADLLWGTQKIGAFAGLAVMLVVFVVVAKIPAPVDPAEPMSADIVRDGDDHRWQGDIADLGGANLEATLKKATEVYSRLELRSVSPTGNSAALTTKAGWRTTGTDITLRRLPPEQPAPGAETSGQDGANRYELTISPGTARPDFKQQVDDLTRLVYLLRESASTTRTDAGR